MLIDTAPSPSRLRESLPSRPLPSGEDHRTTRTGAPPLLVLGPTTPSRLARETSRRRPTRTDPASDSTRDRTRRLRSTARLESSPSRARSLRSPTETSPQRTRRPRTTKSQTAAARPHLAATHPSDSYENGHARRFCEHLSQKYPA